MTKRYWFLTMGLAFGIGFTSALVSAPRERFDHMVRNDFFAGFAGNSEALGRAMKVTGEVLAQHPDHAEALVWHGSGLYYQSGMLFQRGDVTKGMELYLKAMDEMDRAVKLEPDNVGVRIPRGAALFEATRFQNGADARVLGEIRSAVADFQRVFELQKDHLEELGEHPLGQLLLGLGDGYSRLGDTQKARIYFELMEKKLPGTAYEKRAAAWKRNGKLTPAEARCIGCHTAR